MTKRLFAKYPWTPGSRGQREGGARRHLASLKASVATWFVPNNAALFVGGNIDPEEVRAAAEAAFGGWAAGPDPWAKDPPPNPRPGVVPAHVARLPRPLHARGRRPDRGALPRTRPRLRPRLELCGRPVELPRRARRRPLQVRPRGERAQARPRTASSRAMSANATADGSPSPPISTSTPPSRRSTGRRPSRRGRGATRSPP